MPFGAVFGAIVFGVLGVWAGLSTLSTTSSIPLRIYAGTLIVVGSSLALALLLRRPWARWVGLIAAVGLFAWAGIVAAIRGAVLDYLLLLAALTAALLLAIPATGDLRRAPAPDERLRRVFGRVLAWAIALALGGLVSAGTWAFLVAVRGIEPPFAVGAERGQTAAEGPVWLDFAPGLERAKAEAKPVLVDFYADWCGPCRVMERRTFRHPEVVERLGDVVPVRVDAEDTRSKRGVRGTEVADRYGVRGYPTLVLMDGEGRELDRVSGFLNAEQFLRWLDRALARTGRAVAESAKPPALPN